MAIDAGRSNISRKSDFLPGLEGMPTVACRNAWQPTSFGRNNHEFAVLLSGVQVFVGQFQTGFGHGEMEPAMIPQTVVHLFGSARATHDGSLMGLLRRLGSGRFGRSTSGPAPGLNRDPYLLVLLADQELDEGREEQARYLVEAAYDFFDKKTQTNVYDLNLAG